MPRIPVLLPRRGGEREGFEGKGRLRAKGPRARQTTPHLIQDSSVPLPTKGPTLSLVKKSDSAKCRAPNPLQGRITRAAGVLSKNRVGASGIITKASPSYLIRPNVRHQGSGMLSAE